MTELIKKFELVAGDSHLNESEFITDTKSKAQAEIDNPLIVPAITNAVTTKALIVGMEAKIDKRGALILAAKQLTKDIKADKKTIIKIVTDDWPPLIMAAIAGDEGKATLLGYKVKWVDAEHAPEEPSIKNSIPLISEILNRVHLEQEISVINSKSGKVGIPWDVKHINIYEYFGKEAPTSLKQCAYLGIMKRGLFINHFSPDDLDKDVWYIVEYVAKDEANTNQVSAAVKSKVI